MCHDYSGPYGNPRMAYGVMFAVLEASRGDGGDQAIFTARPAADAHTNSRSHITYTVHILA